MSRVPQCARVPAAMFYCTALLLLAATADVFGRSVGSSPQVGIVGGDPVSISEVPYMASLHWFDGSFLCGASIIHERFLLTAAHCCKIYKNIPKKGYKVFVGDDNPYQGDSYIVEKSIMHKKYGRIPYDYDICLVKLSTEIRFGPNVSIVALADENSQFQSGMTFNATGWGSIEESHQERSYILLRQVSLPFVNQCECATIYEEKGDDITNRMLCAGGDGKGHCYLSVDSDSPGPEKYYFQPAPQGDSGGPLTWDNVQVGIISGGHSCSRYPGVNTKVSVLLPWIEETITNNI